MARDAIHPGEHLGDELDALDMSAAELARQLRAPTNRVTAILNGTRAVTGDSALQLGHFQRLRVNVALSAKALRAAPGWAGSRRDH